MRVEENGTKASIYTEYNADFVSALKKKIGGATWDSEKKCWNVPIQSIDTVRALMMTYYGETDISEPATRFSVRFNMDCECLRSPVIVFGRSLATAVGRDSGAKLGDGFEIVDGEIESGGSWKNWRTIARGTFIAHGVTQAMIDNEDLKDDLLEIIPEEISVNSEALKQEREKLSARIKEIDELLRAE